MVARSHPYSSLDVYVNPKDLRENVVWSHRKTGSFYIFFIRLMETTVSRKQLQADLKVKTRVSLPDDLTDTSLKDLGKKVQVRVQNLVLKEWNKWLSVENVSNNLRMNKFKYRDDPNEDDKFSFPPGYSVRRRHSV